MMNNDSTKSSMEQALLRLYRRCANEIPAAAIDALILAAAGRPTRSSTRPSFDLRLPFALAASLLVGLGLISHFDREKPLFAPQMLPTEALSLWPDSNESSRGLGLDSLDTGYRD